MMEHQDISNSEMRKRASKMSFFTVKPELILFILSEFLVSESAFGADGSPIVITKEWLGFLGSIIVALIAGIFGIYQLRRSISAQRLLEEQKLISARHESELAREREVRREFRQERVLPFLEELDRAVTRSYAVVQIPHYYVDLAGYVPLIRKYADKVMNDWFDALEKLSDTRIKMIISIDPARVRVVVSLLADFVKIVNQIVEGRHLVWYKKISMEELNKIHQTYVSTGYRLMLEVKNAALRLPSEEPTLSEETEAAMSEDLSLPLERGGVISIPFGSQTMTSWIAIWEIDTRPDWQEFEEKMVHTSLNDFNEALTALVRELNDHEETVEVNMLRAGGADLQVFCLPVKFAGEQQRKHFLTEELADYRKKYSILWSSFRSPYEIVAD